ncbi:MAG: barstar family protein [Desulfobacterales bacterium]|nr:barstar family protein [Desulfobacterales bacterium]
MDSDCLEELAWAGARVCHLKGESISNKGQFLERIAEVMDFPDYFGKNGDALEDCLTDLAWIEASDLVLIFDRTGNFSRTSPGEWKIALEVLRSAEDYWAEEGPPRLHLILMEDPLALK